MAFSIQLREQFKMNHLYKGILGLVLWLSMIGGILPYKHGSWFSWIVTLLLLPYTIRQFGIGTWFIVYNHILLFMYKYDRSQSSLTVQIIQWSCSGVLILVNTIGLLSAVRRLRHMDRSLEKLDEIKIKLNCKSLPRDRRTRCLVISSILLTLATRIVDFAVYAITLIRWFHNNSWITLQQCWMVIIQMQTVAFPARVLLYLRVINDNLEKLINKENLETRNINENRIVSNAWEPPETNTVAGRLKAVGAPYKRIPVKVAPRVAKVSTSGLYEDETVEQKIRIISECYRIVLDVVKKTTTINGTLIIAIIFCHMLYAELNLFRFIVWISGEEKVSIATLYVLVHSILHALALMVLVDPFHRTHDEMERTSLLVQTLKFRCTNHKPLYNELELFQRLLLLQKTTYSPLGMCTLDRSLVVNILSTLISYLVILTTYGAPIDSPLLFLLSKEA